ncbi:hypothetical protein F5Y10DRAFT_246884 [Nemania abortiva]|nr:hypothetical protein F5Y10DRAFT_246884 [Nemania abortiva]
MSLNFASLSPEQQQQVLNGPSLTPPLDVEPNFTNPPNSYPLIFTVVILCLALATIFFLLCAYGKWYIMKAIKASDYFFMIGYLFFIGFLTIWFLTLTWIDFKATLVHQWDVQFKNLHIFLYLTFIGANFYVASVCLLKVSILLEWLRIFSPSGDRTTFFWMCCATITFNIYWWSQSLIVLNLQCIPHRLIWDKTVSGHCIQEKLYDVITASINLILDLIVLILPQRVIWRLKMSSRKKLRVSAVFAVGLLACASAAGRLWYTVRYWRTEDGTYEYSAVGLWSIAEITCGIIVFTISSVPKTLYQLGLSKMLHVLMGRSSSSSKREIQKDPKYIRIGRNGHENTSKSILPDSDTHNLVPLESFGSVSVGADAQRVTEPGAAVILRTTQLETTYEDASRSTYSGRGLVIQHPWVSS